MADPLPAVPLFRLPELQLGTGVGAAQRSYFGLAYDQPIPQRLQLFDADEVLPRLDAGQLFALVSERPQNPLLQLPLADVGGTTVLRLSRSFAVGGRTLGTFTARQDAILGTGGAISFRTDDWGNAGLF